MGELVGTATTSAASAGAVAPASPTAPAASAAPAGATAPVGAAAPAAPATAPALAARDLTLSWDGTRDVVRGVSLAVGAGETVCMVGRSGCGKTTILHALAGLTRPKAGQVLLHGEDLDATPGRVSYMFQRDLLLPHRRVIDNVCLPLTVRGIPREEARAQARPLLERFGLAGAGDSWPDELSGGMRQRAAFLRTYLMGNDVMLLDEPFSALDAITRRDLRSWFLDMASELGFSSLLITHDVDEAVSLASRVYVLGTRESDEGAHGGTDSSEAAVNAQAAPSPTTVVGEVPVDRSAASIGDFELTPAFLDAKRSVLELLG